MIPETKLWASASYFSSKSGQWGQWAWYVHANVLEFYSFCQLPDKSDMEPFLPSRHSEFSMFSVQSMLIICYIKMDMSKKPMNKEPL